jgi:uncharacterized protein YgbK (DUF1537 family)
MNTRLVIIADDLTGAADAAAAYGSLAESTVVLDAATGSGLPAAAVVAIDTDSRHGCAARSADAVTHAVELAIASGAAIYKKVDSTLRGNIAVEVGAALRALPGAEPATALFAPAFPDTGRTVVGGVLLLGGQPLASGRHGGDLRALYAEEGLRAEIITLDVVRGGIDGLACAYRELRARGARVICCDAQTNADLATLWHVAESLDGSVLPVGSAGLARAVATRFADRATPTSGPEEPRPADGPVLTVLGSYSALARQQYKVLTTAPGVRVVALAEPFGHAEQDRASEQLDTVLRTGDALLVPDPNSTVRREHAPDVAAAMSQVTGKLLLERHQELAGLVIAGGETARAVLLATGALTLRVRGELEPGVVRCTVPALAGLPLVTKAGAFGDPGTLDRARRALHERSHDSTVHTGQRSGR